MADPVINTAAGAFILGLLTSAHCSVMCGPLLCAALPKPSPGYHIGRMTAYTALGAAAGAVGTLPLRALLKSPASLLPWMLVMVMAAMVMGWKPRLPKPRVFQRMALRFRLRGNTAKGFLLGLLTPLLPCGPLYLVLAACLVSGSAAAGAGFALTFTLGTVPLLWVSQAGWSRLHRRFSPAGMRALQRSLAAVALLMMLGRIVPNMAKARPSGGIGAAGSGSIRASAPGTGGTAPEAGGNPAPSGPGTGTGTGTGTGAVRGGQNSAAPADTPPLCPLCAGPESPP